MRLGELDAKFLKRVDSTHFHCVDTKAEADGVMFLCPKCFAAKGGPVGTHSMICWQPSVPQDTSPFGGRWEMHGTGIDDLTLVAGSSSVQINGGCNAHFHIKGGAIEMC